MATEQPVSLGVSQMEVTLVARLSRRTHDLLQPTQSIDRFRQDPLSTRFTRQARDRALADRIRR